MPFLLFSPSLSSVLPPQSLAAGVIVPAGVLIYSCAPWKQFVYTGHISQLEWAATHHVWHHELFFFSLIFWLFKFYFRKIKVQCSCFWIDIFVENLFLSPNGFLVAVPRVATQKSIVVSILQVLYPVLHWLPSEDFCIPDSHTRTPRLTFHSQSLFFSSSSTRHNLPPVIFCWGFPRTDLLLDFTSARARL